MKVKINQNISYISDLVKQQLHQSKVDGDDFSRAYLGYKEFTCLAIHQYWEYLEHDFEYAHQFYASNFVEDFFSTDPSNRFGLTVEQTIGIFELDKQLKSYCSKKVMNFEMFGERMRSQQKDIDYTIIHRAIEQLTNTG